MSNDTFKKLFQKKEKKADPQSGENKDGLDEAASKDKSTSSTSKKSAAEETPESKDGYKKVSVPWSISVNYSCLLYTSRCV